MEGFLHRERLEGWKGAYRGAIRDIEGGSMRGGGGGYRVAIGRMEGGPQGNNHIRGLERGLQGSNWRFGRGGGGYKGLIRRMEGAKQGRD